MVAHTLKRAGSARQKAFHATFKSKKSKCKRTTRRRKAGTKRRRSSYRQSVQRRLSKEWQCRGGMRAVNSNDLREVALEQLRTCLTGTYTVDHTPLYTSVLARTMQSLLIFVMYFKGNLNPEHKVTFDNNIKSIISTYTRDYFRKELGVSEHYISMRTSPAVRKIKYGISTDNTFNEHPACQICDVPFGFLVDRVFAMQLSS